MGKATKRERQKSNKLVKEQERQRIEKRTKSVRAAKTLGVILIVPIIIAISMLVNNATTKAVYTAKITVAIDNKEIGTIEVKLDEPNAPKSVKHFISYASNGDYNGIDFFSAIKDQAVSAGALNADGTGSLGSSVQAEFPPRDFKPGDLIWQPDGSSATAGLAGSSFSMLTGNEKSEIFKKGGINEKSVANSETKSTYRFGYIGFITKGLDIARKIEALAPEKEIDPATNKAKVDEQGNELPAPIKPTKTARIVRVLVYKDGKEIKPGDYANLVTTTTSSTTTSSVPAP